MMSEKDINKLMAAGGKRWTKYNKDRIYIDATTLGLEVESYKTGNVRSATWQGESISNADARRLLGSKVYVDVADGTVHVSTDYYNSCDESMQLKNVAAKFVADALADKGEEDAPESGDAIMTAKSLDSAYDAMAAELVAHKGETAYLKGLIGSLEKRFGVGYTEMEKAVEPRIMRLLNN